MTLSAHVRIYNEEDFIKPTIECLLPYVDDVYVYDTGSTDRTVEIVHELMKKNPKIRFGSENFQIKGLGPTEWTPAKRERFISCLNDMKQNTKEDWILKVDGDEIYSPELLKEIREVIVDSEVPFYSIPQFHFINWKEYFDPPKVSIMSIARLYKNIPEVVWVGARNEKGLDFLQEVLGYKSGNKTIKISSRANQPSLCRLLKNPFLHLGQLRKGKTKNYRFQERFGDRRKEFSGKWPDQVKPYVGH